MSCRFIKGVDSNGHEFSAFKCTCDPDAWAEREALIHMELARIEHDRELLGQGTLENLAKTDAYLEACDDGYIGTREDFEQDAPAWAWLGDIAELEQDK